MQILTSYAAPLIASCTKALPLAAAGLSLISTIYLIHRVNQEFSLAYRATIVLSSSFLLLAATTGLSTALILSPSIAAALIRYSVPETKIPKKELPNPTTSIPIEPLIALDPTTLPKIQSLGDEILKKKRHEALTWHHSQPSHFIFSIDTEPNVVFKLSQNNIKTKSRHEETLGAYKLCSEHDFNLLVVPKIGLFDLELNGTQKVLIAEERLDINPNPSWQEYLYRTHADRMDETIRQMAQFICVSGFDDVEWRNAPFIQGSTNGDGPVQLALVDLEAMSCHDKERAKKRATTGLVKVIHCVSEKQGAMIIEEAKRDPDIWNTDCEARLCKALEKRKEVLRHDAALEAFYIEHNIRSTELIPTDLKFDFSKYPDDRSQKVLNEEAPKLIEALNAAIESSPSEDSLKKRRQLSGQATEEFVYIRDYGPDKRGPRKPGESFLDIITEQLVSQGYAYGLMNEGPNQWYLQA